jgi:hypothetical protein
MKATKLDRPTTASVRGKENDARDLRRTRYEVEENDARWRSMKATRLGRRTTASVRGEDIGTRARALDEGDDARSAYAALDKESPSDS